MQAEGQNLSCSATETSRLIRHLSDHIQAGCRKIRLRWADP
jgi:hypothetical protein